VKLLIVAFLLIVTSVLNGQQRNSYIQSSLTVRHLHEGGWSSHVIELSLTSDALLLSGRQVYSNASGNSSGYCTFPSEIRLDRIIAVEAKSGGLVNSLKIFSASSKSHTLALRLEYHDDSGGKHSYDLIPSDARQQNNEWFGGNEEAMRGFAEGLKYAVALREQQLLSAGTRGSNRKASPVRDPITGNEIEPPTLPDAVDAHSDAPPDGSSFYKAQMCLSDICHPVTVWPVSPVDPARLRVVDDVTNAFLIDVTRKDIAAVNIRQQVVERRNPTPGQITVRVPLPLISPGAPKVYRMCLQIRVEGRKQANQCFISDLASCRLDAPCEEGMDGGRHMVELERQLKSALGTEHAGSK